MWNELILNYNQTKCMIFHPMQFFSLNLNNEEDNRMFGAHLTRELTSWDEHRTHRQNTAKE